MTTEPIAVESPVKPLSALRSLAASLPPLPKPADKAEPEPSAPPKPAGAGKPAEPGLSTPPTDPSPRPGLFARLASRFTRKRAVVGASAVFSVVAGAAGVRLLVPPDPDPRPAAVQPVAPAPKPAPLPPAPEPEPNRLPLDTIPPAALPLPSVAPVGNTPEPLPAVPPAGRIPPPTIQKEDVVPGGGPVPPVVPARPAEPAGKLGDPAPGTWGVPPKPADLKPSAEPDLFGASGPGSIIPVVGNEPAKPAAPPVPPTAPGGMPMTPPGTLPAPPALPTPPAGGTGPALPPLPGADAPKPPAVPGPMVPAPPADGGPKMPAAPVVPVVPAAPPGGTGDTGMSKPPPLPDPPDFLKPEPKGPPPPVAGSPIDKKPIDPPAVVPVVPEKKSDVPAAPPDLGPAPAATPVKPIGGPVGAAPDADPGSGGMKLEFSKPPSSPAAAPVERTERAPTTSYDVDIHYPKAGDTWETVSREFYGDARYAAGLRAYNRNRPLQGGVDVPPLHVVRRYIANPPGAVVPAGRGAPAGEWGAAPAGRGGEKSFRVPPGGMSMRAVARAVLGSDQRWGDIHDLNPQFRADETLPAGTELRLPPDARTPG